MALWLPSAAGAWHWKGHLYAANHAIEPILSGRDAVEIDGRDYPVAHAVADAIRSHPNDYRGGVVGPDGFPDIIAGQGSIHPDTHTNNGTTAPDMSPGHSYTWEWLAHVYQSGWTAYNTCGGCDDGKRDLAFAYGFLTHASGDVWAHTLINSFARGVFPGLQDVLANPVQLEVAVRHVVVESYIEDHTPKTDLSIDIPQNFVFNTFIGTVVGKDKFGVQVFLPNPTAVGLGQGALIKNFVDLYGRLVAQRDVYDGYLEKQKKDNPVTCGRLGICDPVWTAKRAYLNAWIDDVVDGLKAYPDLNLSVARKLAGEELDLPEVFHAYVAQHLLSMLGFPDFVGAAYGVIHDIHEFVAVLLEEALKPIEDAVNALENWAFKAAFGITLDELKAYLLSPSTYINLNVAPIHLPPTTSATLDQLMGLTKDGVANPEEPFDETKFAAMHDSIQMAKLTLLNGDGLNALLGAHGVANHFAPDDNIMLGWVRSIDADHQWQAISPRDGRQYGEGTFFLWKDCNAREKVFRALFRDWEGTDFPATDCAPPVQHADLALMAAAAPRVGHAKRRLRVTYVVTNAGPDPASKVKLTGSVSKRPLSITAIGAGAACTGTVLFTCTMDTLAAGETLTVTIAVRPAKRGKVRTAASVTTDSSDGAPGNNHAALVVEVKKK